MRPMTVRQVFYQATVRGIVEKTEAGYAKVQTDLVLMRRAGELPYDWLADNTRWQRKPRTFDSVEDALERHRRVLSQSPVDRRRRLRRGLAGEGRAGRRRLPGHQPYDVPLMVARGYASLSFLHSAAEYINELDVPDLHLPPRRLRPVRRQCRREDRGDAARAGARRRNSFRAHRRHAATDREWDLPTRPTKTTDTRSKGFGDDLGRARRYRAE